MRDNICHGCCRFAVGTSALCPQISKLIEDAIAATSRLFSNTIRAMTAKVSDIIQLLSKLAHLLPISANIKKIKKQKQELSRLNPPYAIINIKRET